MRVASVAFSIYQTQTIKSHARTAVIRGLTNPPPAIRAETTAIAANTKIITPNTLHLIFFMPIRPKIPARSIRTLTVAEISAGTLSAIIALIAEMGPIIPQMM